MNLKAEKVLIPKPERVEWNTAQELLRVLTWIFICGIVPALFITVAIAITPAKPSVWPENGPAEVFGVSMSCEVPKCPEKPVLSFLAQTVECLVQAGASSTEIRDFMVRAYTESRYNPVKVSRTKDHGITQINQTAHSEVDVERLKVDPQYVVQVWLPLYRYWKKACGSDWQCCYQRGIAGCRGSK